MGEARDVADQITEALTSGNIEGARKLYADDATAVTPDQGDLHGGDAIIEWLRQFAEAFPDVRYESLHEHEAGNVAIDEGYVVGTHTAPLPMPNGETLEGTGKQVRIRSCDVVTVDNGRITSHRFYYDQMEFLGQLGLMREG